MDLAAGAGGAVENKQVLYQSGVTLPPGRFALKVVVRENVNGAVGSFETVYGLRPRAQTGAGQGQLGNPEHPAAGRGGPRPDRQPAGARRHDDRAERDPRRRPRSEALLLFRGLRAGGRRIDARRAREPRVLSRESRSSKPRLSSARRSTRRRLKATLFRLEVPADAFKPGLYTCQVNVIDAAARKFAFPRLAILGEVVLSLGQIPSSNSKLQRSSTSKISREGPSDEVLQVRTSFGSWKMELPLELGTWIREFVSFPAQRHIERRRVPPGAATSAL